MVILIGCLIAFSAAFTVATDSFDRVTTAQDERADRLLDRQNTAIEIGVTSEDNGTVTVPVTNTGSTVLSIDRTDLLVDGEYRNAEPTVLDGSDEPKEETDLWLPGETLEYGIEPGGESVKIVTQNGVAATAILEAA
ncbi:fla cluster protein flaF [Halalkalicoccus sp. NIPERK01]|nr:fla cluster protein flaF [Halalkalicoccus sp. NIPERK01]